MITQNGYIVATTARDENYEAVLDKLGTKPAAPDGYIYRLRADNLEWELVELPPAPDPDEEEITAEEVLDGVQEVLGYEA